MKSKEEIKNLLEELRWQHSWVNKNMRDGYKGDVDLNRCLVQSSFLIATIEWVLSGNAGIETMRKSIKMLRKYNV